MKNTWSFNNYHGDETKDIRSTLRFLRHSRNTSDTDQTFTLLGRKSHEIPCRSVHPPPPTPHCYPMWEPKPFVSEGITWICDMDDRADDLIEN